MGRVASTQKVALADLKSLAAPRMISSDSAVEVVSEREVGAATLDLLANACFLTMRLPWQVGIADMLLSNSNSDSDASHAGGRSRQYRAAGLSLASLEAFEEKLAESVRPAIAESPSLVGCLTG